MAKEKKSYTMKDFNTTKWPIDKYNAALKVTKDSYNYADLDKKLREDPDIALLALSDWSVSASTYIPSLIAESGKGTPPPGTKPWIGILAAAEKDYRVGLLLDQKKNRLLYMYLPENVQNNSAVAKSHVTLYRAGYSDLPEDAKKDISLYRMNCHDAYYGAQSYASAPEEIRKNWKLSINAISAATTNGNFNSNRCVLEKNGYKEEYITEPIEKIVPDSIRNDKEALKKLIMCKNMNVTLCGEDALKDPVFFESIINMSTHAWRGPKLPKEMSEDRDLALKYGPVSGWYYTSISEKLYSDKDVMLAVIRGSVYKNAAYELCDGTLKDDYDFNKACIEIEPDIYTVLPWDMRKNQEFFEAYIYSLSSTSYINTTFVPEEVWNEDTARLALDVNEYTFSRYLPSLELYKQDATMLARLAEEYPVYAKTIEKSLLKRSKEALEMERAKSAEESKPVETKPSKAAKTPAKPEEDFTLLITLPNGIKINGAGAISSEEYDFCRDFVPETNDWWLSDADGREASKVYNDGMGEPCGVESVPVVVRTGIRPAINYEGELLVGDKMEIAGREYVTIFNNKLLCSDVVGITRYSDTGVGVYKGSTLDTAIKDWYRNEVVKAYTTPEKDKPVEEANPVEEASAKETPEDVLVIKDDETLAAVLLEGITEEIPKPEKSETISEKTETVTKVAPALFTESAEPVKPYRFTPESGITGTLDERLSKAKAALPHVTGRGIMGQAGPVPRKEDGTPKAVITGKNLF